MTAPTSHDAPDRAPVESHIQRKVAVSALRRIGHLVSDFDHQDRVERRNARIALFVLVAVTIGAGGGVLALTMKRPKEPVRIVFAAAQLHDVQVSQYARAVERRLDDLKLDTAAALTASDLRGAATLAVSVRADGTVERIDWHRSSGSKALDEAAESTVRRAAPFEPFPQELRSRADVLVIQRTFTFP